ncbi:MAG: integrase arm-type DNA-binding domain-containing protein [Holophagaceae bacterium]|nr:integrase arm-type DNA-binding domain-containing protein [Holophagaceae bacterium]
MAKTKQRPDTVIKKTMPDDKPADTNTTKAKLREKLTDEIIRKTEPLDKRFKLFDGKGLYIQVETTGGKLWRFKYRFEGRDKLLALGKYPAVSLEEARKRHLEAKEQLAHGIDPAVARRDMKAARGRRLVYSFELVALEWFGIWREDKTEKQADATMSRLEKHVFPIIGNIPITEVKTPDLLRVGKELEKQGTLEMARQIKGFVSQVLRYATATGRVVIDQSPDMLDDLMTVKTKRTPSLTDPEIVTGLIKAMETYQASKDTKYALLLAPLVLVSPGELRKAKWEEIEFDNAGWVFQFINPKK